jgi:hypothetical protein
MMTAEQNIEIQMYGMTQADLHEQIQDSMYISVMKDPGMLVMSMLSDAQEMVQFSSSPEMIEEQRKFINRAKFVLRYYVMDKETV